MTEMSFEEFMKLHDAVKTRNRLDRAFRSKGESDEEVIEGYIMEDERCDGEIIEGYMIKEIDSEETQRIEAHLDKCDSCRKTLEDMNELRDVFNEFIADWDQSSTNQEESKAE